VRRHTLHLELKFCQITSKLSNPTTTYIGLMHYCVYNVYFGAICVVSTYFQRTRSLMMLVKLTEK